MRQKIKTTKISLKKEEIKCYRLFLFNAAVASAQSGLGVTLHQLFYKKQVKVNNDSNRPWEKERR